MKNLLVLSLALASFNALAGKSATLTLKGTVAPILDISVSSETLATNLPLNQAVTDEKVGTVTETSNSATGFSVSVSSQNAGKLVLASDSSHYVNYSLSYDGNAIALGTLPVEVSNTAGQGEYVRDLAITYSKPSEYLAAGDYSDVVTFTISAN